MPALMATISGTDEGWRRALDSAKVEAGKAAVQIVKETERAAGGFRGWNMVIRETLVVLREIGRGNWTRVPGSLSLLLQALNNKIPFLTQLLTPLNFVLAGVAVAGLTVAHAFKRMADEEQSVYDVTGKDTDRFLAMAKAMETVSERAQDLKHWLSKLQNPDESLAQSTEDTVRDMQERFEVSQRIAEREGQTAEQKKKRTEDEKVAEQGIIDLAKGRADEAIWYGTMDVKKKAKIANDVNDIAEIDALEKKKAEAAKLVEEKQKKVQEEDTIYGRLGPYSEKSIAEGHLKEAQSTFNAIESQLNARKLLQKQRQEDLADSKSKLEKDTSDKKRLEEMSKTAAREVDKVEESPAEKQRREILRGSINSLQRIGAYTSPGEVTLIDVSKKMENHLRQIVRWTYTNKNYFKHTGVRH